MNAEELARKIENKEPVSWEYSITVFPDECAGDEDCIARLTITAIADGTEVDEQDAFASRRGDEIDIEFCDAHDQIKEKCSHRWLIAGDAVELDAVGYDMLDHAGGIAAIVEDVRAELGE